MKLISPHLLFAIRNVFRHRARSAATLAAIGFGVASLILAGGFIQDIYIQLGEAIIHSQTGHIQIAKQGYSEGKYRNPEEYLIDAPEKLKNQILNSSSKIDLVAARLTFSGTLNNGKRDLGIFGEGIEPDLENKIGSYLRYIDGRPLQDSDTDGIVIGQGVARNLGLKPGDRVTVLATLAQGAVNTLDFQVVGIFQSFSKEFDARAIRIPLTSAQGLMDTQSAHLIVVNLANTADTPELTRLLENKIHAEGYSITPWNKLSDFYEKTLELYERQFGVLRLIILVMVLLSVANSINMTLFERTREFGTMQAIGNRPRSVFTLVMFESLCLGAMGALIGVSLGCLAALAISAIGIPMPPPPNANQGYTALIRLTPSAVLTAGVIGFIATLLATLLPARKAAKLNIVDALRHGI